MKKFLTGVVVLCALTATADDADDPIGYAEYEYERWYVDAQATLVLPQGGAKMHRRAGATTRFGYYVQDFLTLEGSAAWLEDTAGLGVRGLWHWWGYESVDPFFTFGANGWISGGVGPSLGWGCFWHYDDNWSIRADAETTLDVDGHCEMIYALSLGVQYAF